MKYMKIKVSEKKMYFILVNVIKELNQAINVIYMHTIKLSYLVHAYDLKELSFKILSVKSSLQLLLSLILKKLYLFNSFKTLHTSTKPIFVPMVVVSL